MFAFGFTWLPFWFQRIQILGPAVGIQLPIMVEHASAFDSRIISKFWKDGSIWGITRVRYDINYSNRQYNIYL